MSDLISREAAVGVALNGMWFSDPEDHDETVYRFAKHIADALRDLPAAPASARVSVNPLEWEGAEDDCYVIAETMIGTYEVSVCDTLEMAHHYVWDCKVQLHNPRRQESVKCQRQSSFLDAKAAAQDDFEARILAALSQPAQE